MEMKNVLTFSDMWDPNLAIKKGVLPLGKITTSFIPFIM